MSDPDFVVRPQLRWDRPFAADLSAKEGARNCACAVGAMGAFRVGGATYSTGSPIGDDLAIFLIVRREPAVEALAATGPSLSEAQLAAENAELKNQLDAARAQLAQLRDHIARADQELDASLE